MDELEGFTQTYLQSLKIGKVVFEPLGFQTFPDFSVGGKIAVEATRLRDIVDDHDITTSETGTMKTLRNAIARINRNNLEGPSYGVSVFLPPGLKARDAADAIKAALRDWDSARNELNLKNGISLHLYPGLEADTSFFLASLTRGSGTLGFSPGLTSCSEALQRKADKARSCMKHFTSFWLAVTGWVTSDPDDGLIRDLQTEDLSFGIWEKIILINSRNPEGSIQVELSRPTK